jgi:hypothetical protein
MWLIEWRVTEHEVRALSEGDEADGEDIEARANRLND